MAYESVKRNNSSGSPAHQPARENPFAPRPYNPQPEQETDLTAQPETYTRESFDLIRTVPVSNPYKSIQTKTAAPASELEPEQDNKEQESETTEKLSSPSNPEQPNNNHPHSQNEQTPIQTKLTIGEPGDKYEQQADTVARQVMSMNVTQPSVQRQNQQPETSTLQLSPLQRRFIARTQAEQQNAAQPKPLEEQSPFVQRYIASKTRPPQPAPQPKPLEHRFINQREAVAGSVESVKILARK